MNYGNTNRGQGWLDKRNEENPQPDFKCSLNVKGEEFWISAWKRKDATNGEEPGYGFSVQPKQAGTTGPAKDYVVNTDNQPRAWD